MLKPPAILSAFVFCALSACSKDDKPPESNTENEVADTKPEASRAHVRDLFPKSFGLPQPLAKLHLGMAYEDAQKVAPELFFDNGTPKPFSVPNYDSVKANVYWGGPKEKQIIDGLSLDVDTKTAQKDLRAELAKLWGPPKTNDSGDSFWQDDVGLRATLEGPDGIRTDISYGRFTPLADFLGSSKGSLALGAAQYLGMDKDQAMAAIESEGDRPMYNAQTTAIHIYYTLETTANLEHVSLSLRNGKVVRVYFRMQHEWNDDARSALLSALERDFGKAKKETDGSYRFGAKPTVSALVDKAGLTQVFIGSLD